MKHRETPMSRGAALPSGVRGPVDLAAAGVRSGQGISLRRHKGTENEVLFSKRSQKQGDGGTPHEASESW